MSETRQHEFLVPVTIQIANANGTQLPVRGPDVVESRLALGKLAGVIHPYPTQADGIRQTGDQYNRTRLTPLVKKLFNAWLRWTR